MFQKMSALTFSQELGQVMTGSSGNVRHLAVGNTHCLRYMHRKFLQGSFTLFYLEIHIILFETSVSLASSFKFKNEKSFQPFKLTQTNPFFALKAKN